MVHTSYKQRALTMPQRLAAVLAMPQVNVGAGFHPVIDYSKGFDSVVVIPLESIRTRRSGAVRSSNGLFERLAEEKGIAKGSTLPARVDLPCEVSLQALAIQNISLKNAKAVARWKEVNADYFWRVEKGRISLHLTESGEFAAEEIDSDANESRLYPDMVTAVEAALRGKRLEFKLPKLTSARKVGWRVGRGLQLCCDKCSRNLLWVDWWHADATKAKRNCFVFCPDHGGPVTKYNGKKLQNLVRARQELDGAIAVQDMSAEKTFQVYALEVIGAPHETIYIGETSLEDLNARRIVHKLRGKKAAAIFRRADYSPGEFRQEILPELPALHSKAASTAAENWAALWIEITGSQFKIEGGH